MNEQAPNGDLPVVLVTIEDARKFIKGIVEDESLWPILRQNNEWAGHLHRVALELALRDEPPETEVDIVPLYLERRVQEPSYVSRRNAVSDPDKLRAEAIASIDYNMLDLGRRKPNRVLLEDLAAGFGYPRGKRDD